jgi:hypothetical protein
MAAKSPPAAEQSCLITEWMTNGANAFLLLNALAEDARLLTSVPGFDEVVRELRENKQCQRADGRPCRCRGVPTLSPTGLAQALDGKLAQAGRRFVRLTAKPGAGESVFTARLVHWAVPVLIGRTRSLVQRVGIPAKHAPLTQCFAGWASCIPLVQKIKHRSIRQAEEPGTAQEETEYIRIPPTPRRSSEQLKSPPHRF